MVEVVCTTLFELQLNRRLGGIRRSQGSGDELHLLQFSARRSELHVDDDVAYSCRIHGDIGDHVLFYERNIECIVATMAMDAISRAARAPAACHEHR